MPVFEPAPGGRSLKGYIYSPFTAADFLASAIEMESAEGYDVALYDGPIRVANILARGGQGRAAGETVTEEVAIGAEPTMKATIVDPPRMTYLRSPGESAQTSVSSSFVKPPSPSLRAASAVAW